MNQEIPITSINILIIPISYESNFTESFNILDSKIIETVQNIKDGRYQSVKDILTYIILILILNGILDVNNPIIYLRISGDGRNVDRKIKQVIITIAILNDKQNIHKSGYHYTTVLFSGVENYEVLKVIMVFLIQELDDFRNNNSKINEII